MGRAFIALSLGVLSAAALRCDAVHRIADGTERRRTAEMAMFEAGYGTEWHKKVAARYNDLHRADHAYVDLWGDQRSDDIVKPRILRGDPPAIIHTGGLPIWTLIAAGKLVPFDKMLDEPAYGSDRKWRDLFRPGTLDMYAGDGHVYGIPFAFGAWSCWYNARLFREHGWQVPKTWSEFTTLCERIRAAGIEPVAFQGKYPLYAWWTLLSLIQRCGGVEAINRLNMLEPGAFTHPDVVWAARLMQELALKHFQHGALAMTHTESQLQFVNDKAALIFCGVWLENEQKTTTAPDFEMRCFNVPAVEGGKGNPLMFCGEGAEFMFTFADAKNPEVGQDFCRFMVSPDHAPDMGKAIGVISPLIGATPRESVSPALRSVLDMVDQSPGIFFCRVPTLLLRWQQEHLLSGLDGLINGSLAPEEFCRRMEAGLERERRNPDRIIPKFTPLDPAKFGEPR